jgi:uncharacterized protein HemX
MDTPHPAYETGGRGYPARGERVDSIHAHQPKSTSKARTILPLLIIAVIALAIIGYFVSRHRRNAETTTPDTTQQTQQQTTPADQNTQTNQPAAVPMQTPDGGMQSTTPTVR